MVAFDFFAFVAVGGGRAAGGPAARAWSVESGCVGPVRGVRGRAGPAVLAGRVLDGEAGEKLAVVEEELRFSAELHETFEHKSNKVLS